MSNNSSSSNKPPGRFIDVCSDRTIEWPANIEAPPIVRPAVVPAKEEPIADAPP
jgi:hypothetical protein